MKKTVLITGGTGMVGRRLTEMLLEKNYEVAYLSRRKENIPNVTVYRWDIDKGYIEAQALETADYIVHLAGAGIADARWTAQRKREIIESRTKSIELIANELQGRPFKVKACVAASAIGFYGANTGDEHLNENHPSGTDFLAHVTRSWEQASERMDNVGVRTTKLRIGIVLSSSGGALPKIAAPIRLGVGAPLASGEQWVSWIHLDDLCRLFIEALENPKWSGIYNAVGAQPVTNAQLTRQIADVLNRPLWLPHIPAFTLQLVYGEMADVVLGGNYVLNQRIAKQTDFQYSFTNLTEALQDLLAR
ncbi:MAG: TIGR01777 family protein [Cytophagia bacterium]|nr:MAG: TIGR01777 family protein [Runella sp.]TAG20063.1 MAG: TIGR01777 family protein [Cytophagales bacterium]TAG39197.1 MAG: TIGR01777 family protein [Cytophagia bacterium]TAG69801.1 MAG: TIGR01777 family protein [Runella slithyformis]TAG80893.1 MAG: TIGR01777 family protein [Cytophagales bacterium]